MPHEANVDALIREIRWAVQRLGAAGDALHKELGITSAMRGILETLSEQGPRTVPQIARAKSVSRQHVQTLVDVLRQRGLCSLRANPAHARSAIIDLTPKGRAVFETARECEQKTLDELAAALPGDVSTAVTILRRLNAALLRRLSDDEGL